MFAVIINIKLFVTSLITGGKWRLNPDERLCSSESIYLLKCWLISSRLDGLFGIIQHKSMPTSSICLKIFRLRSLRSNSVMKQMVSEINDIVMLSVTVCSTF